MEFQPQAPNILNGLIDTLSMSPQPLSNLVANSKYAYLCVLGPECPNMEIRPQAPKFWGKFENYSNFRMVASVRFQRALNHFPILSQTQIMPIFVFSSVAIFKPINQNGRHIR